MNPWFSFTATSWRVRHQSTNVITAFDIILAPALKACSTRGIAKFGMLLSTCGCVELLRAELGHILCRLFSGHVHTQGWADHFFAPLCFFPKRTLGNQRKIGNSILGRERHIRLKAGVWSMNFKDQFLPYPGGHQFPARYHPLASKALVFHQEAVTLFYLAHNKGSF